MKSKVKQPLQPLLNITWKIDKLYEKLCMQAAQPYGFTRNEVDVLLFLSNNRDYNTARDIVRYRLISKSLVSKSLENLVSKGYIESRPDSTDRRYVRLYLTPQAEIAATSLNKAKSEFFKILNDPITPDERELLMHICEKIAAKIDNYEGKV